MYRLSSTQTKYQHTLHILSLCIALFFYQSILASAASIGIVGGKDQPSGRTLLAPRSQGYHRTEQIVGILPLLQQTDEHCPFYLFSLLGSYSHSIRQEHLAAVFFGTDCITLSGSEITNRTARDLVADYFGLSTRFQSTVTLRPSIRNFKIACDFFCNLHALIPRLFLHIHAPIVFTWWRFGLSEDIEPAINFEDDPLVSVNAPYPAGYMGPDETPVAATSFAQAMRGGLKWGHMQDPLRYGLISCATETTRGLADLHIDLGYLLVHNDHADVSLALTGTIPTGTRRKSRLLFEPIVGNGHHGELGIRFAGRVCVWQDFGQELFFGGEIEMGHMFSTRQRRSFDLARAGSNSSVTCQTGCQSKENITNWGSRYMLFKEFDGTGNYTGRLTPVINHTTLDCTVSMAVQISIILMFNYTYRNFSFDVGYNGWFRSKEKVHLCKADAFPANKFALKGIQNVTEPGPVLSNATQSTASLVEPTLTGHPFTPAPPEIPVSDQDRLVDNPSPVFTPPSLIDIRSGATPRLLTHALFLYFGYCPVGPQWEECHFKPFGGIGGEIEFEDMRRDTVNQEYRNTLSQGSLWLKGGIYFD